MHCTELAWHPQHAGQLVTVWETGQIGRVEVRNDQLQAWHQESSEDYKLRT